MGQEAEVADDGNHRTGYSVCNLNVSRKGIQLIYDHMMSSNCVPKPPPPDFQIPLSFTADREKPGILTVICGICKKELGTCEGSPE